MPRSRARAPTCRPSAACATRRVPSARTGRSGRCSTTERPPREIYVDGTGRRWIAEDEPSIDVKERELTTLPDQVFWMVFDDDAVARAGVDEPPIVLGWGPDDMRRHANTRPGVHSADTLEELAALAGIDPAGLVAVGGVVQPGRRGGEDPEFGRRHLPGPDRRAAVLRRCTTRASPW